MEENYELDRERIRQENKEILKQFAIWLRDKQFSEKTIRNHVCNIDLYANEFLLYDEITELKDGALEIGMFLGYWFIKKAMWSSVNQIKSNAASLKRFYAFMCEKGYTKQEQLDVMKDVIKERMAEWIDGSVK